MNIPTAFRRSARALARNVSLPVLLLLPTLAWGMDIDLFTINNGSNGGPPPNILIVLDNTSNWSRQSQQWPGGIQQGQSEVRAIKKVLNALPANVLVNVGLLEFVTGGPSTDNGGYVRFAVSPIQAGSTNLANLSSTLDTIYNNITSPSEKQNSAEAYGNLFYDVYNYLGGNRPFAASADVVSTLADPHGYQSRYTQFQSPLSDETTCARTYVVFIGNPDNSGPTSDASANTTALASLGGDTSELPLQNFTTAITTQTVNLGMTSACYANFSQCSTTDYTATCGLYASCACVSTISSSTGCNGGKLHYEVQGTQLNYTVTPTNTTSPDTKHLNLDEWARFLYQKGVPVGATTQSVTTYTIDVFNAQQNALQTSLLLSTARAGGGRYFSATNEAAIITALQTIFGEVLAKNSAFTSASLPVSATNRALNDNQVYIGMFRPDPNSLPRWYGNVKRYQLATFASGTDLADANGAAAINTTTGFITPCAVSYWTTDMGNYWANVSGSTVAPRVFFTYFTKPGLAWSLVGDDMQLAQGNCATAGAQPFSDSPDGPQVEKGGVGEGLRNSITSASRVVKTLSGSTLTDFTASNLSLSANSIINANIVNFIRGQDVTGEINGIPSLSQRPSIHGDVIHSRPLAIDFGGGAAYVYYGANDGTYRVIDATAGRETWAFVAPEFFPSLQTLLDNSPQITSLTPKPFFFDGNTGFYAGPGYSPSWIYPTMRRGGRMVYSFDLTGHPASPTFKWKAGCPSLTGNTGCTDGTGAAALAGIGQTWSTPSIAMLPGYSTTTPVLVVAGGYDGCEDANVSPTTSGFCSSTTGNVVYILDSSDGHLITSFSSYSDNFASYPLPRSIVADPTFVDINGDGTIDAAYFADTGGNIYRIDFSDSGFAPLACGSGSCAWTMKRVAYTTGAGRKFLFAPSVLPYKNKVYVAIASGDREHPRIIDYPYTTPVTNRVYVYLDNPARTASVNLDGSRMINYSSYPTSATQIAATCNNTPVVPGSDWAGWYMDLTAGQGEQAVTSTLIVAGAVTFSTNRPLNSTLSCSSALGEARGYWLDLLNASGAVGVNGVCGGNRSVAFVGGGLPPTPVLATVTINGLETTVVLGAVQKDGSASSPIAGQKVPIPTKGTRKRVYWRTSGDTR